jgi:hypothetical protein
MNLIWNENRTDPFITVEANAKNLGGAQPLVMLDGWNVTVINQNFSGASIALNTDAQPGGEPRGAIGNPAAVGPAGGRRGGGGAPPIRNNPPASPAPAAP